MNKLDYLFEAIEVTPKNKEPYLSALTHPSCNANGRSKHQDYDRLEFMGDAILDFVVADIAFKFHPDYEEGKLSKLRSNIVQRTSLANYARSIHLEEYIHANKSFTVEVLRESDKILEDVFEAGVKCSAKTMYPDWLSLSGEGYVAEMYQKYKRVVCPMGCRAFLSPWYERGFVE